MVALVLGVMMIIGAFGDGTGTLSALAVVQFYLCIAVSVAVSWWDLTRRGHAPRVRLGIGMGLALFPALGFFFWWSWGIKGNLPGTGSGDRPA